jgi:hypothetical protein
VISFAPLLLADDVVVSLLLVERQRQHRVLSRTLSDSIDNVLPVMG